MWGPRSSFACPASRAPGRRLLWRVWGGRGGGGDGFGGGGAGGSPPGVEVKWFGGAEPVGFTSDHHSWRYVAAQDLPRTDAILAGLFDMRLPLTFSLSDCDLLADHILSAVAALQHGETA